MLKKLQTLAAVAKLRNFDVDELSTAAGVARVTVRTILGRCPPEWFEVVPTSSGSKGGQWLRYELTDVGQEAISKELSRMPLAPAVEPARLSFNDEPIALLAARAKLAKLPDLEPDVAEAIRQQIESNLRWAEREILNGPASAVSTEWMRLVQSTRVEAGLPVSASQARLSQLTYEPTVPTHTTAGLWPSVTAPAYEDNSSIGLGEPWHHHFPNLAMHLPFQGSGVADVSNRERCWAVFPLSEDQGSKRLAMLARSVLSLAVTMLGHGLPRNAVKHMSVRPLQRSQLPSFMRSNARVHADFVCCADTAATGFFSTSELSRLVEALGVERHLYVLDQSYSAEMESFAKRHNIGYQPMATDNVDSWHSSFSHAGHLAIAGPVQSGT